MFTYFSFFSYRNYDSFDSESNTSAVHVISGIKNLLTMKNKLHFILISLFSLSCYAQQKSINGTVYDENKNTLADANVILKNSKKGVITNTKGEFTIDGMTTKDILEISYLGYETKEIKITDEKDISVVLKTSHELLATAEVIAYGTTIHRCKTICSFTKSVENVTKEIEQILSEQRINTIFPNPSRNGLFQLHLQHDYEKLTLEVFNMNGMLLQSTTHTKFSKIPQIDLSKQVKGMYLIRIIADGTVLETKKAVKL